MITSVSAATEDESQGDDYSTNSSSIPSELSDSDESSTHICNDPQCPGMDPTKFIRIFNGSNIDLFIRIMTGEAKDKFTEKENVLINILCNELKTIKSLSTEIDSKLIHKYRKVVGKYESILERLSYEYIKQFHDDISVH